MPDAVKISLKIFAEALVLFLLVFVFVFPMSIRGDSMEDVFYDGDRVLISRFMGVAGLYDVGDIVIFKEAAGGSIKNMVKRVIAVENDVVAVKDGRVFVNDVMIEEEYINGYTAGNFEIVVPKGKIFVMGDNREKSFDSRQCGSIDKHNVRAKVIAKIYPLNEIKFI